MEGSGKTPIGVSHVEYWDKLAQASVDEELARKEESAVVEDQETVQAYDDLDLENEIDTGSMWT